MYGPGFSMLVKLREEWTVVRVGRAEVRMRTMLDAVRPIRIRIERMIWALNVLPIRIRRVLKT